MTALCPAGGTSSPRPGFSEFVAVSSGAIALALQKYGASKLQFLIPLLGLPPLELPTFCATDPPAMPTFTSAEVFSLLRVGLDADYFSGLAKARDMVLRMLWEVFCQCDSGTATPPPAPGLPVDTPDPIPPAGAPVAPCAVFTQNHTAPLTGTVNIGGDGPNDGLNITRMDVHAIIERTSTGTPWQGNIAFNFKDRANNTLVTRTAVFPAGTTVVDFVQTAPAGFSFTQITVTQTAGTGGIDPGGSTITYFCNGNTPGVQQPCCPPDPATQNSLDLILSMLTLIQRQGVPFGYVPSTVHAGLSGAGAIPIAGLIGAAVNCTTIPDSYGRAGTNPTEYFDLGFVTFGTGDGWPSAYRVQRQNNLFLPARCAAYTDLEYDLAPGVQVTITELLREP